LSSGYRTWYYIVGNGEEPGKFPLLVLHGGPGASHDYLEPLEALANTGRRVIFYDQLGGGNSSHPHNPSMWSVELFVEELGAVRKALSLDRLHLLGQSWGGVLGMEQVLGRFLVHVEEEKRPDALRWWPHRPLCS
jgi:proline-specific peptidase